MGFEVRGEPSDIDAGWMTAALERGGVARGATVTELAFTGFVGTGQMSRNGRFALTWDEPEGRPVTVMGKFPSLDETCRTAAFQGGAYRKEYLFYAELAATVDVRSPRCWFAGYDDERADCVLLLEDLVDSRGGDHLAGITDDEVSLAVEQAVALHAPRWGDPALAGHPAFPATAAERAARLGEFFPMFVEGCLAQHPDRFDDDVTGLLRRFGTVIGRWSLGTGSPATLVHGDFRPDNFLFGRNASAPPLAIVDWQTYTAVAGPTDLAYLLGGSFEAEPRRRLEAATVEEYRARLAAAGIDYPAADCWRDYRWGSLHGVMIAVTALLVAARTERGDEVLTLMAERHARHALELDALGVVEAL
jgi:hypothetical protein